MMKYIQRLALLYAAMVIPASGFTSQRGQLTGSVPRCRHRNALHSSSNDGTDKTQDDSLPSNEWQGFNPFDPTSQKKLSTASSSLNRISLRKNQMQELMNNLLGVAGNKEAMQVLLESSKGLLLEPLEDVDAVLDTDSIYNPSMTREERYQVYRSTMLDRIANTKRTSVRDVLQTMSDFVLSHE